MTQGVSYFVDPVNGSDGNDGLAADKAFASLTKGEDALTANQNDVLYYMATSSAVATLTATLTWDKNYTHLVGIVAPTNIAQRARVFASGATTTPMVNVTASGCSFRNLYFFHGIDSATAEICFQVTGGRNYFENVHFAGIGHATQGDDTAARSLLLAGAEECLFQNCTIGVDTTARSGANAELGLTTQAHRCTFDDCLFLAYADDAGHLFVHANAASTLDRFILFRRCAFINAVSSAATTMTAASTVHASAGGMLVLKDCTLVGATDWHTGGAGANIYIDGAAPTAGTSGLAVTVT
jgi:hypothetical protein